jgi:hypothetical protein
MQVKRLFISVIFLFTAFFSYIFLMEWLHNHCCNKILVVIVGNHRGGNKAWDSLKKHLLVPYTADLATFYDFTNKPNKTALHEASTYVWNLTDYENWDEYFTEKGMDLSNFLVRKTDNQHRVWSSGIINHVYRYEVSKNIISNALLSKYSHFVVTRSDFFYRCQHMNVFVDKSSIWIPEGEDWGGINDRHIVCPASLILQCLSTITHYFQANFTKKIDEFNPEAYLEKHFKVLHLLTRIRRYQRSFFLVKTVRDTSRWRQNDDLVFWEKEQLFIKYFQPYVDTIQTCFHPFLHQHQH